MARVAVIYDNRPENMKEIGEAVVEGVMRVGGLELVLKHVDKATVTAHYGAVAAGKPGVGELEACRILGSQIAKPVNRMHADR